VQVTPSRGLRVLVASPIRFYADGLAHELARTDGIEVVGVARTERQLVQDADELAPDVVLLDVSLTPNARNALPRSVRVVALAVAEPDVLDWAEHGVDGLVTRDSSLADVAAAIRDAHSGELHCSPRIAAELLHRVGSLAAEQTTAVEPGGIAELTVRELEILRLIDNGLSNKEIAYSLSIETTTVKNHVHNLFEKLGVHRRRDAVATLRRTQLRA
jgi:two-component system, NarL family, nitrate/nitrite response regulator NarL